MSDPFDPSPPDDGRRFEILEPLGSGGFGTVYRALAHTSDGEPERVVALKVPNEKSARLAEEVQRLRDEARILKLLDHPSIVRIEELLQLDGRWTIVMEYVEGVTLKRIIESGAIEIKPALEAVALIAAALHQAYETRGPNGRKLRLLHRDIKPSNVLLTAHGALKVLDFGIARANFEEREAVTLETQFGSLGYMAPERLDGRDSPTADVYSLGVVLYELLTGETFGRTSANRARHEVNRQNALTLLRMMMGDETVEDCWDDTIDLVGEMLWFVPEMRPKAGELQARCARIAASLGALGGESLSVWAGVLVPELLKQQLESSTDSSAKSEFQTGSFLSIGLSDEIASAEPSPLELLFSSDDEPPSGELNTDDGAVQDLDFCVEDLLNPPVDPSTLPHLSELGVEAIDYWDVASVAENLFDTSEVALELNAAGVSLPSYDPNDDDGANALEEPTSLFMRPLTPKTPPALLAVTVLVLVLVAAAIVTPLAHRLLEH